MYNRLWFSHDAYQEMLRFSSLAADGKEAAGLLFGYKIDQDYGVVTKVVGPGPGDERHYHECTTAQQTVIDAWATHWKGLIHDLGIWHTHPLNILTPSDLDDNGMRVYLTYCNEHGFNPGFSVILHVPPGGRPGDKTAWYYTLTDRTPVEIRVADEDWKPPIDENGNWIERTESA